jgi:hypothetical protein
MSERVRTEVVRNGWVFLLGSVETRFGVSVCFEMWNYAGEFMGERMHGISGALLCPCMLSSHASYARRVEENAKSEPAKAAQETFYNR